MGLLTAELPSVSIPLVYGFCASFGVGLHLCKGRPLHELSSLRQTDISDCQVFSVTTMAVSLVILPLCSLPWDRGFLEMSGPEMTWPSKYVQGLREHKNVHPSGQAPGGRRRRLAVPLYVCMHVCACVCCIAMALCHLWMKAIGLKGRRGVEWNLLFLFFLKFFN